DQQQSETTSTATFLFLPLGVFLSLAILSLGVFFLNAGVSDRSRAESALRNAEEKYRSIFENAAEGIFQTTPDGGYVSVNPALARMYGYGSPDELMTTVGDIGQVVYVNPERRTE